MHIKKYIPILLSVLLVACNSEPETCFSENTEKRLEDKIISEISKYKSMLDFAYQDDAFVHLKPRLQELLSFDEARPLNLDENLNKFDCRARIQVPLDFTSKLIEETEKLENKSSPYKTEKRYSELHYQELKMLTDLYIENYIIEKKSFSFDIDYSVQTTADNTSVVTVDLNERQKLLLKNIRHFQFPTDNLINLGRFKAKYFLENTTDNLDFIEPVIFESKNLVDGENLFETYLIATNYYNRDCHACMPITGVAVKKVEFPQNTSEIKSTITQEETDLSRQSAGGWGNPPSVEWLNLNDKYNILAIYGSYMAQGIISQSIELYQFVDGKFNRVEHPRISVSDYNSSLEIDGITEDGFEVVTSKGEDGDLDIKIYKFSILDNHLSYLKD